MEINSPKNQENSLVEIFFEFDGRQFAPTKEEIIETITELGLDREELKKETNAFIAELQKHTPLDWRNREDDVVKIQKQYDAYQAFLPKTRDELVGIINELLQKKSKGLRLGFEFRNKKPEDMSDEELISLLKILSLEDQE
jgi:protoporphyrinogen oxidase